MNRKATHTSVAALLFTVGLAFWCDAGRAQGNAENTARDVVDKVLRKAERDDRGDLDGWSRSVIERALERAARKAPVASGSVSAEGHAGELAGSFSGGNRGAEVIVFMSLSASAESWRQWSREAARIGAPLVLRGLAPDGFRATVKRIGRHLERDGGAAIDPRLFRLFDITVIPAVAVVPGGVPPCQTRGCLSDAAPAHDRIAGNIGLRAALKAIAEEGGPGRATARRHLTVLRGDFR